MSNMDHFCTNLTVFGKVVTVPAGSTSSLGELQSKLCALDVNITKLFNELEQSLDGLSEVVSRSEIKFVIINSFRDRDNTSRKVCLVVHSAVCNLQLYT